MKIELTLAEWHKNQAITCFNETWELIDKKERTTEEDLLMIHKAHASCYHWGEIGESLNRARGEWLVSRVYSLTNQADSALYHAQRSFNECLSSGIKDVNLAFAYEALSHAYLKKGQQAMYKKYYRLALEASESIHESANKTYFLEELHKIKPRF